MLDHLSHGRAEIGVGRGVSPFELKYHKVEHEKSRDIFIDAYRCIARGLTTDTLTYKGPYYEYENVPIALRPCRSRIRRSGTARPAPRARPGRARRGCTSSRSAPTRSPRPTSTPSRRRSPSAAASRRSRSRSFPAASRIGVQRHIFVDETDDKAHAWARPAMNKHLEHINWIRTRHGVTGDRRRAYVPRAARTTRNAWRRAR